MAGGIPPTGGGGDGGQNQTENVMSTFLKSVASGAGKMASNALTLGGAHAFEEGRKKDAQTQAALQQSMKDRASRGETFDTEDYRAWQNAGGDPSVVAGLQKDALGINRAREESRGYLEQLHKGKVLNDQQYSMWAMALHSNDPTATALAMEGIKSQAQLAGIQAHLAGQEDIEKMRESGAEKRTQETTSARHEDVQTQQEGADRRTQANIASRERTAKISAAGKAAGFQKEALKGFGNVTDAVAAASGDPATMKKMKLDEPLTYDQAKVAFATANDKLAGTKGVSLERMAGQGAFILKSGEKGGWLSSGTEKQATGVGIPALIESAAKEGVGGITPEIAADFRKQWATALREKEPKARADALDKAISSIPDPDVQQQLYAQLQDMNEQVQNRMGAESTESGDDSGDLGGDDGSGSNDETDPHYDMRD